MTKLTALAILMFAAAAPASDHYYHNVGTSRSWGSAGPNGPGATYTNRAGQTIQWGQPGFGQPNYRGPVAPYSAMPAMSQPAATTNYTGNNVNRGYSTNYGGNNVNHGPATNYGGTNTNLGPATNYGGTNYNYGPTTNYGGTNRNYGAATNYGGSYINYNPRNTSAPWGPNGTGYRW